MGTHSFSLDPRTILGVGSCATRDEIREAYRSKSKKHHPDLGGDEWAFRMVARAYEVLTATTPADGVERAPRAAYAWTPPPTQNAPDVGPGMAIEEFRAVDVNLIWMRFEVDGATQQLSAVEESEETLSVCMVISWPDAHLIEQAATQDCASEILHTLVDLFQRLRGSNPVFAGRSRIEDGQFVGWLSYPSVLAAQDAFLHLRETLQDEGLAVRLRTIDERVPLAWHRASEEPVMAGTR